MTIRTYEGNLENRENVTKLNKFNSGCLCAKHFKSQKHKCYGIGENRVIFPSTITVNQRLLMKRKAVYSEHPMQINSGEIAVGVLPEKEVIAAI